MIEKEQVRRTFKVSINSNTAIDLVLEGDADLVDSFIKQTMTDTFGTFYKMRDTFSTLFINGIKHEMVFVRRDEKGPFVKSKAANNVGMVEKKDAGK